jgi:hypothetical protein
MAVETDKKLTVQHWDIYWMSKIYHTIGFNYLFGNLISRLIYLLMGQHVILLLIQASQLDGEFYLIHRSHSCDLCS